MPASSPLLPETARAISRAVTTVPGVAELTSGAYGEIALLYPGERVAGMRLERGLADADRLEIHVIVDLSVLGLGTDLHAFSRRIRSVASAHTELPVTVVLADAVGPSPAPSVTAPRSTP